MIAVMNIAFAQMPIGFVETVIAAEQSLSDEMQSAIVPQIQPELPVRVINNKHAKQIFIKPEIVLSEATLNIIDQEGNPLMAYHFDHLSEIDLSIKSLPAGNYTLNVHSEQGSSSHKLIR